MTLQSYSWARMQEKSMTWKDTCSPVFPAALSAVAKTWNDLNVHHQRNGWRRCSAHTHTHTGILLTHQKEWNSDICSNTGGPKKCHNEWSKSDREGDAAYDIPYTWNLKRNDTNELTKQKETQTWEINLRLLGGVWGWSGSLGGSWTHCCIQNGTNKDALYSTWNSMFCVSSEGRGCGGEWMHAYVWLRTFAAHPKLPQHCYTATTK